jgi:uncharacterized protein with PIN domain
MNTELLIQKIHEIHGDKYILDNVVYNKNDKYIYPECPEHGIFRIRYDHFLNGTGCKGCFKEKMRIKHISNTEEFKNKLEEKFPGKFDVSKVKYINAITPVILICHEKDEFGNEHGEFKATPNNILSGNNCPKCCGKYVSDTVSFLKRVQDVFGEDINEVDFSKFIYEKSTTKSIFICHKKDKFGNEHGEFKMTPNNFLKGERCPKCSKHILKDTEYFIKESKLIWGNDRFDYRDTKYFDDKTNVTLICHEKDEFGNEHGSFTIKPYNHLRDGCGCPKCNKVLKLTQENFEYRVKKLYDDKYDLSLVHVSKGDWRRKIEVICHEKDKDGIEHGIFKTTPQSLLSGHSCPICGLKNNITELRVYNRLKKEFGNVVHNYRNHEIFGLKSLDCYLPDYKIAVEVQGLQHFEPVEKFGGEKEYIETVQRDNEKYNECLNNNIKLFYFKNTRKKVKYNHPLYTSIKELVNTIKKEIR